MLVDRTWNSLLKDDQLWKKLGKQEWNLTSPCTIQGVALPSYRCVIGKSRDELVALFEAIVFALDSFQDGEDWTGRSSQHGFDQIVCKDHACITGLPMLTGSGSWVCTAVQTGCPSERQSCGRMCGPGLRSTSRQLQPPSSERHTP